MVSLPDPRDFGNGGCSVRPCLQSARLQHHTSPLKPSCLYVNPYIKTIPCNYHILLFMFSRTKPGLTLWPRWASKSLWNHTCLKLVVFFLPQSLKCWSQALAITCGLLSLTFFFFGFIFLGFFSILLSSIYFYFLCTCYFFTYKA